MSKFYSNITVLFIIRNTKIDIENQDIISYE